MNIFLLLVDITFIIGAFFLFFAIEKSVRDNEKIGKPITEPIENEEYSWTIQPKFQSLKVGLPIIILYNIIILSNIFIDSFPHNPLPVLDRNITLFMLLFCSNLLILTAFIKIFRSKHELIKYIIAKNGIYKNHLFVPWEFLKTFKYQRKENIENLNKTIAYGAKYNINIAQKNFGIYLYSDTKIGLRSLLFNHNLKMLLSFSKEEEFNYVLDLLRKRQLKDSPF